MCGIQMYYILCCRVLEVLEPFERVILKEEMWLYQYPFIPNTIPSYVVVVRLSIIIAV